MRTLFRMPLVFGTAISLVVSWFVYADGQAPHLWSGLIWWPAIVGGLIALHASTILTEKARASGERAGASLADRITNRLQ